MIARPCLAILLFLAVAPSRASGQEFSPGPLKAEVAFPNDSMPRAADGFLAWLESHGTGSTPEEVQAIREHLYALISEAAKERYASRQSLSLQPGDTALARLFLWAHRLGVPGAAAVASTLVPGWLQDSPSLPTDGFHLTFEPPYFSLVAHRGNWMVRFPYFFMLGMLARQRLENEVDNDIAVLSTLMSLNSPTVGGASQATLFLASAQGTNLPVYTAYWLNRFGIAPLDTVAKPVPGAMRAYRTFDPNSKLWKELVVFSVPSGALVVAYIGLDGTYQANRTHYIDFLGTLRVRR